MLRADASAMMEHPFNVLFTVCDNAAGEVCPIWPGTPTSAHWGIADPGGVENDPARTAAFREAFAELEARIDLLVNLPIESLDRTSLQERFRQIGGSSRPGGHASPTCSHSRS